MNHSANRRAYLPLDHLLHAAKTQSANTLRAFPMGQPIKLPTHLILSIPSFFFVVIADSPI